VVALLSGAAAPSLSVVGAAPAHATTWTVSLSADASDVEVGTTVTLTATANQSLTGTGYFLDIFDQTTGTGVGYCSVGSSCQVTHSEAGAGSHTFVAYVDGDPVFHYPPCCVQATSNAVTVNWHARATALLDVEFSASGTLPTFPCDDGCDAPFSGWGSGAGNARAEAAGVEYSASFVVPSGYVTGTANYAEPGPPFCPAVGTAVGTVSLNGPASGLVYRTSTPSVVGFVTGVTFDLAYTYQRAGPGTLVTVTGGTARIAFTFPDTGADYFVSHVAGAGPGAFEVHPVHVTDRCQSPGELAFTVVGDVALVLM
jgi:hypothetical protein